MKSFPLYKQPDAMDCSPAYLRIACPACILAGVAKYYGRSISLEYLRNKSQYGKEGVSMPGMPDAQKVLIL